jgi:hypothetical protein
MRACNIPTYISQAVQDQLRLGAKQKATGHSMDHHYGYGSGRGAADSGLTQEFLEDDDDGS